MRRLLLASALSLLATLAVAQDRSAAPAGVKFDNTGHHHLLVDTDLSQVKLDAPLPATDKILLFGKGQTETVVTLAPGKHTLELLFADYLHVPFDPPLHSKKITITVK
jgi:hypothetical protein